MPEPGVVSFFLFLTIMAGTLVITHWAAEQGRTTVIFYTAQRSLTGVQNGLAIAGDYISAASFLGTTGAVALFGYHGFLYSIGFLSSYLFLMLWVAEPVHRLGLFSLGDVFYARFPDQRLRLVVAFFQFVISLMYLVPQLVASGLLLRLLLGLDYVSSVLIIGTLMTIYVTFGGMTATSWVQIIKTVLLLSGTILLVLIAFARYDWQFMRLFQEAEDMFQKSAAHSALAQSETTIQALALLLTLFLGTSGLPHILMRLFTVRSVRSVRISILTAALIIGLFYLITLILGFAARVLVGYDTLRTVDPSGNLAAPLLANVLGGAFLVAFVVALAFATILAVVTGLVISATTALSYDVYHQVLGHGKTSDRAQLRVAKLSAIVVGILATAITLGLAERNVAYLVALTFLTATSSLTPVLMLTLYWRGMRTYGVAAGLVAGVVMSLSSLFIFHGQFTGVFLSIPITLIIAMAVSLLEDRRRRQLDGRLQLQVEDVFESHAQQNETLWRRFFVKAHGRPPEQMF